MLESQKAETAHIEELETARKNLKDLLNTYLAQVEKVQELQTSYQNQQKAMFDLLDDLKNKKARSASLEAILKNHSNF